MRMRQGAKILIGAVTGAAFVVAVLYGVRMWQASNAQVTEEAVRRAYVVEYSKAEQEREGVNCRQLRDELKGFLNGSIPGLLEKPAEQPGGQIGEKSKQYSRALAVCSKLYTIGHNGRWNNLEQLGFAGEIERDFIRIDTILRYTLSSVKCDAQCRDSASKDLADAYRRVVARLS